MLLKSTLLALAAAAAVVPSAHGVDTVGVGFCAAYSQDESRGRCTMTTPPGNYTLTLVSQARYAWAHLDCVGQPKLAIDLWNTDADYPITSATRYNPGPSCTLTVAAGNGGTAVAYVHLTA